MNESPVEFKRSRSRLSKELVRRYSFSPWAWLLLIAAPITALAQKSDSPASTGGGVMVVAVSRNDSVLAGGISTGGIAPRGKVYVEPLAWLSPSGGWESIHCDEEHPQDCRNFERDYLKKPHTYTVISADGRGASVHVEYMALDECYGFGGLGTYSGVPIAYAAVAANSTDIFTVGDSAKRLTNQDAEPVRQAFAAAIGDKLDSTKELRVYSLRLEAQSFVVVQRAFQDYADAPEYVSGKGPELAPILAIGTMRNGKYHLLSWENKVDDDNNEQILGTIHLKSGRDFLVTTVSDTEGQYFHVYGIQKGKLTLVYSGGGGSC